MADTNLWIILIGVIGLFFIISPFLSNKKKGGKGLIEFDDWHQRKEQVFSQLADLEYDYQMDKLSETDYQKTKSELTIKAATFVTPQSIDPKQVERDVDKEIEQMIKEKGLMKVRVGDES